MKINLKSGTVLVYTMVLVVLGVFMATVVLNEAVELSSEYEISRLENSLVSTIRTKGDLSMKYSRELNRSGSGFIDNISCPQNIIMSGATLRTTNIDTQLRFLSGSIQCVALAAHNGNDLKIYFNDSYTDIWFAQFSGTQVPLDSSTLTGTFGDIDATLIDLGTSAYLSSDGIDDNFDSDNYLLSSTGSTYYPDGYSDNDDDSRLMTFGFILEDSGFYNILWTNTEMSEFIQNNPNNNNPYNINIGNTSSGYLYLDINTNFRLALYEIDKSTYDTTKELIAPPGRFGTGQLADIGYMQNDLSLSPIIDANTFRFDFTTKDYALFVENTSSGALLYKIRGYEAGSGSGIYMNPLDDSDISIFSYLGSHMLIDDEGRLIADQMEIFGLK